MKLYLRRLWAALCGRPFTPLAMSEPIVFRTPGGTLYRLVITGVDFSDTLGGPATLQITASTREWLLHKAFRP